ARDAIARKIEKHEKFVTIDRAVADEGWKIVLLTRLSPVFPFTLLNYAFGLTRVKLSHYAVASWLGMIPGTVMYVYLGSLVNVGGHRQRTTGEWILYGVGLLATVAVTVFVTRLARNALAKKIGDGNEIVQNFKKTMSTPAAPLLVEPRDSDNARLVSYVHPS